MKLLKTACFTISLACFSVNAQAESFLEKLANAQINAQQNAQNNTQNSKQSSEQNSNQHNNNQHNNLGGLGSLAGLDGLDDLANLSSIGNMAKTGKLDGSSLMKELVDQQCRKQLNDRQEWQLISMLMSKNKKQAWEDRVCGCATEETVNAASSSDIVKVVNPSTRNETVAKITTKAVTACIKRLR